MKKILVAALIGLLSSTALGGNYAAEKIALEPAAPKAFAISGSDSPVWLEASGGPPVMKTGRGDTLNLTVPAGARALTGDGSGRIIILTGDRKTGFTAHHMNGTEKLRAIDLKPSSPITEPTDIASVNEILWVLQQKPPLAAFFGTDGMELGRADLTEYARAPYSIALDHTGRAFITDPTAQTIIELTPYGRLKTAHQLNGTGITRPTGIAVGPAGRVWISDTVLNEVTAFKETETGLKPDETVPRLPAEDPLRLAVTPGKLWVLGGWNGLITRFGTE